MAPDVMKTKFPVTVYDIRASALKEIMFVPSCPVLSERNIKLFRAPKRLQ